MAGVDELAKGGLLSNEGIIPETGLGLDGVGTVLGPGIKGMLTGDFNAFSGIGTVLGYAAGGPIGAAIGGAIGKSIGGGKDVDRNIHFGGLQIPDEAPEFIQRFKLGGGAHDLSDYRGFDHVFNNLANPVRAVSDIMVKRLQTLGLDELGQEVTDARANLDAVASSPQHASFKIQQLLDVVTGAEVVVQNAFDYIDNNPEKKSLFENSSGVSFDNFKKELDRQGFEYFHGQIIDPLYTLAEKNIESDVSNYQNQTISPDEIRKAIDSGAPIGGELERAIGTHTKRVAQEVMGGNIVLHEGLYYQADGAGFPIAGTGVSAGDLARMRAGATTEEKALNPITPEIIGRLQEENTKKVTEGQYRSVGEISRQGDPRERTKEFNTYFNGDFRNPIIDISGARNAFIGADNTGSAPVKEPTPQPQQGQGFGIKEEQNRQLVNDLFEENPWMKDVYGGADNVHLVDSSKDPERLKANIGGGGIEFYPESEPGLPEIPNPDFGKKTRLEIFSEDLANDPEALKSAVYLDLFHGITTHPKFKPYTDQIKNSFTPKQKAWHDEQALELGIDINSPEDMDAFYDRVVTPKYLRGAFNILPDNSLGELAGYAKGFRGPNELWPGHSTDLYTQEQRSIIGELSEVLGQKSLQPGLLGDAFIPGEATAPSPDIHVVDPRDSNDLRYDPGMPDVQELTPQPDTTTPDLGTTDISPFTGDTSTTSTFSEEARKAVEGWERELEAYESSLTPERIAEIRGEIDRGGITTDPNKKGFGIPTSTLLGIAALGTGLLTGGGSGSNTTDTETPETPRRLDIELPPSTQFSGLVGSSNTSPYNTPYTEEVLQGNIKPQKLAMMSELELPFRDERAFPFVSRGLLF